MSLDNSLLKFPLPPDDPALNEAVNVEFATVLVKCLSLHLPAWAEAWAEVFRTHYSLATTVFEAFKTANETRLAKVANLVGAHKSPEAVETAALGTFLTSHFCSRGEDAATLCLQVQSSIIDKRCCHAVILSYCHSNVIITLCLSILSFPPRALTWLASPDSPPRTRQWRWRTSPSSWSWATSVTWRIRMG